MNGQRACGDVERREGIANCKTDRKSAKTARRFTAALMNMHLDQSHLLNLYLVSVSGILVMMVEWSPQLFIT